MSADDYKFYVPQTLDDAARFLLWDLDVAMVFIVCLGIGIMAGFLLTSGAIGIVAAWYYSKSKSGRNKGYGLHLLYWYMPAFMSVKRAPPSNIRHFIG
jgi:conjugal transfer pilus assembly protein TraL